MTEEEQMWNDRLEQYINTCINERTILTGYREETNPFRIVAFQNGYIVTESVRNGYHIELYALFFKNVVTGVIETKVKHKPITLPKMFAELIEKRPTEREGQSSTNGAYTKFYFGIYKEFIKKYPD